MGLAEYRRAIEIDNNFHLSKLHMVYIEEVYRHNPHLVSQIHHNLAVLLSRKGLCDDAEYEYKMAIEFNPKLIGAYNGLGCLYVKWGRLQDAENILNQALGIKGDLEKIYYNLGVVYAEKKEIKKAAACWQKALSIKPDYLAAKEAMKKIKDGE
jgi:tetratricopeptide (TPR) repeat protein